MRKGREIATDIAICAPQDNFDPREGEKIAVGRVAELLVARQRDAQQKSLNDMDYAARAAGVLKMNFELPKVEPAEEITKLVMAKLDKRRAKRAVTPTLDSLADIYRRFLPHYESLGFPFGLPSRSLRFSTAPSISIKPNGW